MRAAFAIVLGWLFAFASAAPAGAQTDNPPTLTAIEPANFALASPDSFGVTTTGIKWGLAEGRNGGPRAYQTFGLVSNATDAATEVRATFLKKDGTIAMQWFNVGASQRFNIDTGSISELANSNFSTIVETTNGAPISVESAIYWSVNGVTWEGGGNTVATRIP